MSTIKIKDLPEKVDNLDDEDLLIVEDREDTKKISLIRLRSSFSMDGILTSIKNMLLEKINTFVESHNNKYKELLDRNTQLEVLCHNLSNDHIHDAERIFKLEDELIKQTTIIDNLEKEKDDLFKSTLELQNEKDNLSEQIVSLKQQQNTNETAIVVLKSQVKDLQRSVKELNEVNTELQSNIDTLENESVNKIDENFTDINTKVSEIIADIMAYIRYYHPDVDDIL